MQICITEPNLQYLSNIEILKVFNESVFNDEAKESL